MKERKKETQRRCTAATRQRCANILKLVKHMREAGPMLRDDIFDFLHMSPSGGRKYVRELRENHVLLIERFVDPTPTYIGHPLYRLNQDARAFKAFLEQIEEALVTNRKSPSKAEPMLADPSRRIHIMGHDEEYPVLAKAFKVPPPDPLLAALFGFAGAAA